jgi:cytochrome c oxidase subunit IV
MAGILNRPLCHLRKMTLSFVWAVLLPLLLLVVLIDLATMSPERRIRLLKRSGLSQRAIAERLGISRYRVRLALA